MFWSPFWRTSSSALESGFAQCPLAITLGSSIPAARAAAVVRSRSSGSSMVFTSTPW